MDLPELQDQMHIREHVHQQLVESWSDVTERSSHTRERATYVRGQAQELRKAGRRLKAATEACPRNEAVFAHIAEPDKAETERGRHV